MFFLPLLSFRAVHVSGEGSASWAADVRGRISIQPCLGPTEEQRGHRSSAVAKKKKKKGPTALDYCVHSEAKDSGLPKGLEYPSQRAWIALAAEGIGMAQTSNVSTHCVREAWLQKGLLATTCIVLWAPKKYNLLLWLLSLTIFTAISIFFLIPTESFSSLPLHSLSSLWEEMFYL